MTPQGWAGNPLVIYLDSPAQLYKLEESDWE